MKWNLAVVQKVKQGRKAKPELAEFVFTTQSQKTHVGLPYRFLILLIACISPREGHLHVKA
jgi:hypothetical protein